MKSLIGKPKADKINAQTYRCFAIKLKGQAEHKFLLEEDAEIETVVGSDGDHRRYNVLDVIVNEKRVFVASFDCIEYFYIAREVL